MRFTLTEEQRELREVLHAFLTDAGSLNQARHVLEHGGSDAADRDGQAPWLSTWQSLGRDLGVHGLDIPEDLGGTGLSIVELALVVEEMGACLFPGPYLASSGFASGALQLLRSHSDDVDAIRVSELLTVIAGSGIITVADASGAVPADASSLTARSLTASAGGSEWQLSGEVDDVLDAQSAEIILVIAQEPFGAVFAVNTQDVTVTSLDTIDPTRRRCRVSMTSCPAQFIGSLDRDALDCLHQRMSTLVAADSLGVARACVERTREYASSRVQFGKPIGSFQAVKHQLADLLVEVELATSAVYLAACHLHTGDPDRAQSATMAWLTATETCTRAAKDAIQLHGGIAFTWEYDQHLFTRRAATNRSLRGARGPFLEEYYRRGGPPSAK